MSDNGGSSSESKQKAFERELLLTQAEVEENALLHRFENILQDFESSEEKLAKVRDELAGSMDHATDEVLDVLLKKEKQMLRIFKRNTFRLLLIIHKIIIRHWKKIDKKRKLVAPDPPAALSVLNEYNAVARNYVKKNYANFSDAHDRQYMDDVFEEEEADRLEKEGIDPRLRDGDLLQPDDDGKNKLVTEIIKLFQKSRKSEDYKPPREVLDAIEYEELNTAEELLKNPNTWTEKLKIAMGARDKNNSPLIPLEELLELLRDVIKEKEEQMNKAEDDKTHADNEKLPPKRLTRRPKRFAGDNEPDIDDNDADLFLWYEREKDIGGMELFLRDILCIPSQSTESSDVLTKMLLQLQKMKKIFLKFQRLAYSKKNMIKAAPILWVPGTTVDLQLRDEGVWQSVLKDVEEDSEERPGRIEYVDDDATDDIRTIAHTLLTKAKYITQHKIKFPLSGDFRLRPATDFSLTKAGKHKYVYIDLFRSDDPGWQITSLETTEEQDNDNFSNSASDEDDDSREDEQGLSEEDSESDKSSDDSPGEDSALIPRIIVIGPRDNRNPVNSPHGNYSGNSSEDSSEDSSGDDESHAQPPETLDDVLNMLGASHNTQPARGSDEGDEDDEERNPVQEYLRRARRETSELAMMNKRRRQ